MTGNASCIVELCNERSKNDEKEVYNVLVRRFALNSVVILELALGGTSMSYKLTVLGILRGTE